MYLEKGSVFFAVGYNPLKRVSLMVRDESNTQLAVKPECKRVPCDWRIAESHTLCTLNKICNPS
jgi:hypothetical protein